MAIAPDGRSLVGRTVRLDVASEQDAEGLFAALDDDRVWEMGYGGSMGRPTSPAGWREVMARAAAEGRVKYVVRAIEPGNPRDGRILGTTSLGDLDLANEKVHLGWTAYTPQVWGTSVNPECKLLLLWHCFEHCGLGRVKLRTDVINVRSQAAIAKLGATREGVARRHLRRSDGTWRDSVIYSVIIDDWPQVKSGLEARLMS
ncbi:MAG TPA: GNAT family protein [Mycobacteriales bacterium]|nr:GNAT family protein [Mycobacteriales bacterium]